MEETGDGRRKCLALRREDPLHCTISEELADAGGTQTTVCAALQWNPRRRTRVAFHFPPNGGVRMELPPSVDVAEARRLLRSHSRWVLNCLRAARGGSISHPEDYVNGAVLFYQGRQLVLRLGDGHDVEVRDGELVAPATATKEQVWAWYARRADAELAEAVTAAASRLTWLRVTPTWRHRYMTSRWGSFSSRGRMSLNTHLVKLPNALVEYVVIHELCHSKHMNHGRGFQRLMDASLADWRTLRVKLRPYGCLLAERAPPKGTVRG